MLLNILFLDVSINGLALLSILLLSQFLTAFAVAIRKLRYVERSFMELLKSRFKVFFV